ncbi:MAG: hypothetical protein M1820_007655 [Bogoriella megaspora]|nr:MAG: hypothetical protein M1820_007655 [Bogoriella megaspora]
MASPTPVAGLRALKFQGCFSSGYPLEDQGSYTFQSSGACQNECGALKKPVMGLTSGTDCFCGDQLPPLDSKLDDDECNTPCAGFNKEFCGAENKWTIYLTGTTLNQISNADDPKSSNSADPSSTVASITTAPGQTVVMTVPANAGVSSSSTASASPSPSAASSSGPNKVGIAVGVVVGVLVLAVIIGGLVFFLRRRRQQLGEKGFARQGSIVEAGRPPGTSHSAGADSRLDPRVFDRRASDGSIADNEDYSRRILKVTNPDRGL